MIRQPDRLISKFISSLGHVGQCFIGLYGVLEARQFSHKAHGKEETVCERHPLLTSFLQDQRTYDTSLTPIEMVFSYSKAAFWRSNALATPVRHPSAMV